VAQHLVSCTDFSQESVALVLLALQGGVVQLLDLLPAFRLHIANL